MRVGFGYDIHKLVKGEELVLGGVKIPFHKKLYGFSDADVLIHSLCDALLGAGGKGDMGTHFPDTDSKYKDISSVILLKEVRQIVGEKYNIVNIDSTLLLEKPNLRQYKYSIKEKIARILDIDSKQVNVKATTQEKLGSIGTEEAIASFSTVLLNED